MGFIKPSISEGMKFSADTEMTEKGSLKLVIEADMSDEAVMQAVMEDRIVDNVKSGFIVFNPNMVGFDQKTMRSSMDILKDVTSIKKKYIEYGKILGPEAEIQAAIGGIAMLDIYPENQRSGMFKRFNEEDVLEAVMSNLSTKFYNFLMNHPNFETARFRHKFHRQKKSANYASIPFTNADLLVVESMDVPQDQSKLQWLEWEKKAGKNDASDPVPDAIVDTGEEESSALFDSPEPSSTETSSVESAPGMLTD